MANSTKKRNYSKQINTKIMNNGQNKFKIDKKR